MATADSSYYGRPKYSEKEQHELYRSHKPARPPIRDSSEHHELVEFSEDVEIVLQTVHEAEYQAAVMHLQPPSTNFEKSVVFPSASTVLGRISGHRVALIQTDAGANIADYIQDAIDYFKKTKFVIGVGTAYAFDRAKYKLGDVLVSKKICDLRNWKINKEAHIIDRGERIDMVRDLQSVFCRNLTFEDSFEVTRPETSSGRGRIATVHAGTFASFAVLMKNREMRDKFGNALPEVIGGEMEGGELMQFQRKRKVGGVIVVKGVSEYGDGKEESNGWQFTAAMAAFAYVRDKLLYYSPS